MNNNSASPSIQRYRSHPVHEALKSLIERVAAERPEGSRLHGSWPCDVYIRFRLVLRDLHNRLNENNPTLVPISNLESIKTQLTQLIPHWDRFRGDPDNQWKSLDAAIESVLKLVWRITPSGGGAAWNETHEEFVGEMSRTIEDAHNEIDNLKVKAADVDKQFNDVQERISGFASEIQAQKTRLDQMLNQQSKTFADAEQLRANQYLQNEQGRTAKFVEEVTKRGNSFKELVDELNATSDELTQTQQLRFDEITTQITEEHKTALKKINEQLDSAVEIVGTIVKTAMSGNYQIIANREYKNAWWMRWFAMGSFLLMGAVVVWAVWSAGFGSNGIEWGTFAFRISLGIAFLIPGLYCATESNRHWKSEKHNRRIALELAAFKPFIVKLDEEKQKEIIEKMANEYFGQGGAQGDVDESQLLKNILIPGNQFLKILQQLAKITKG